jgi:hypothetical protein
MSGLLASLILFRDLERTKKPVASRLRAFLIRFN